MKRLTYEQYLQLCDEQEEAEKNKRPAHRPVVEFFVDDVDKEKVVSVINTILHMLQTIDGSRFKIGRIHFGKNRFWALIYLAMVENGIIKLGDNVTHYHDFLEARFEEKYLVERKHLSGIIHNITNTETSLGSFLDIHDTDDINRLGHIKANQKSFIIASLAIRALFSEEFSKK